MIPRADLPTNAPSWTKRPRPLPFLSSERMLGSSSNNTVGGGGATAPAFTQRASVSISRGDNFCFGGICRSASVNSTARTSKLFVASPGTTAGPRSPPRSAAARLSSRKAPSCFSGPWHDTHFATKSGFISSR